MKAEVLGERTAGNFDLIATFVVYFYSCILQYGFDEFFASNNLLLTDKKQLYPTSLFVITAQIQLTIRL